MVQKYHITIQHTVTRTVLVEAENVKEAYETVKSYGIAEAFVDFPEIDMLTDEKFKLIKKG